MIRPTAADITDAEKLAIERAAHIMSEHGITIFCPWEGYEHDTHFKALLAACRIYSSILTKAERNRVREECTEACEFISRKWARVAFSRSRAAAECAAAIRAMKET